MTPVPRLSCACCGTGSHALVLWRAAHGLQKCEWSYFKLAVYAETTIFTGFRQSDAPNLIWAVAAPRYVASDWPLSESSTGGSMARLVSAEMVRSPGPPYTSNIRPYYHDSMDAAHLDSGGGPAPHAPHVMARYLFATGFYFGGFVIAPNLRHVRSLPRKAVLKFAAAAPFANCVDRSEEYPGWVSSH